MVSGSEISWDSLQTTDDFDTGHDNGEEECASTKLVGSDIRAEVTMVNTPVSLLVQSLIQRLCSMLEQDHVRATNLYDSICKKLHEMKMLDKTYAMGEFECIRSQYQFALQHIVKAANGDKLPIVSQTTWSQTSSTPHMWSRYHREFEEVKFIASGGFGNVFLAKHRLDKMGYAIKKIYIKSCDVKSVMNHLAEVETFATLDHPNIVSYKSAWLEPLLEGCDSKDLRKEISTNQSSSSYLSSNENIMSEKCSERNTRESDFQVSFRYNEDEEVIQQNDEIIVETMESCKVLCKLSDTNKQMRLVVEPSHLNLKWATLYIQMSLCNKTMKTWLEEKNQITAINLECGPSCSNILFNPANLMKSVIDIISQLSRGLHYIHSRSIVHHDIKPSNVFVDWDGTDLRVRLGDFGLACPLEKSHNGVAIGTKLYAAPEQLLGECNRKSDLFSIGLILLEMIETYRTEMEKIKHFTDVREGRIPAHVTANYPKLSCIISKLVQGNTKDRIDTNELLRLLDALEENKDKTIALLKEQMQSLYCEVNALKNNVKEKEDEIMRLKRELEMR